MLDLGAAIHHHCHAAGLCDARALLVDHAELTPEGAGADLDGFGARSRAARRARGRRRRRRSAPGARGGSRSSAPRESPTRAGSRESPGSRVASGSSRRSCSRAARSGTARRWPRFSRCGALAGSSADPGSAPDRTRSNPREGSCRRRHAREALLEIPDQVVDRLDADREPDRPGADSRRPQLVVVELAVRRARGMDDQALRVADVRQVRPERDAADEVLPARSSAVAVEREDRAGAARQISVDERAIAARLQARDT